MNPETKTSMIHNLFVAKANVKHENWDSVIYHLERVLSVAKKAKEVEGNEVV